MENKNLLMLLLGVVIFIIFYFLTKKRNNKVGTKQTTTPDPPSTAKKKDTSEPKTKTSSNYWSTTWEIIATIILWVGIIVLIILGFRYLENGSISRKKVHKTEVVKPHWEVEKKILVNFSGEYGEIIKSVKPGTFVSFENASEPYCIKNKVAEYCGQKGEDVGSKMPNSTNNNELQFKSQNGKNGSIEIVFWYWKKY